MWKSKYDVNNNIKKTMLKSNFYIKPKLKSENY